MCHSIHRSRSLSNPFYSKPSHDAKNGAAAVSCLKVDPHLLLLPPTMGDFLHASAALVVVTVIVSGKRPTYDAVTTVQQKNLLQRAVGLTPDCQF